MLTQDRIEQEFENLVASDVADKGDFITRMSLILICAVALSLAIAEPVILIWGIIYVVLDVSNFLLIRHTPRPVSRVRFAFLLLMSLLAVIWFGGMAVYLSFVQDGRYLFLGLCVCAGLALYCLTNHQAFGIAASIDVAAVVVTGLGISFATFLNAQTTSTGFAALVAGVSVLIYFVMCVFKTIKDRIAMRAREDARAHDLKLRSLGQLTSGVAHDFNNLLTVVGGNIELAAIRTRDAEMRVCLEEARLAAERGASLVAQLLAYSRKSSLNAEQIDSARVLARIRKIAARAIPAGINLKVDMTGDHARLMVDVGLLETAILNLLFNARDALDGQYGNVCIRTELRAGGGILAITVSDDGPGMSPATLQRATEPFYTTKGPGEGTGLGLSMVKGFAEQSGGSLDLRNRPDGGLQASILLPALLEVAELPEAV